VSARTAQGEIMAVRHRTLTVEGVQFHPESILTPDGPKLLGNFLKYTAGERGAEGGG
jgi:anthranilate/para-aminobenzoate synthase component II